MRLALYQPEIAHNVGAMIRSAACFDFGIDIIQPCGFPFGKKQLKHSSLDYLDKVEILFHDDFSEFQKAYQPDHRLILLTTKTDSCYTQIPFFSNDVFILGRESSGVDPDVCAAVDQHVTIPMSPQGRSLNVATAGAILMAEFRRRFPMGEN